MAKRTNPQNLPDKRPFKFFGSNGRSPEVTCVSSFDDSIA